MKISKSLLRAITLAVTVTAVSACDKEKTVKPNPETAKQQQPPYNCAACGMG